MKQITGIRVSVQNDRFPFVDIPRAYGFEIEGVSLALHKAVDIREANRVTKRNIWVVSEVTTGLQIYHSRHEVRRQEAVEGAKAFMRRYGSERLKREIKEGLL